MSQQTTKFKQSFSGSVGAGVGALVNPNSRRYYILEHKVSSNYHKAGESQEIIIDNIEIGRDPQCQVRFDESFNTVSRRHAAIVRDGDNWKLVQLSKTNTTFLNGHPVQNEWYLQSGDEIQLSVNGPKLGFIVPQGKQSLVSSIGFTRRLSLFRQQALRPYKTALWSIAGILAAVIIGGGLLLYFQRQDITTAQGELAKANKTIEQLRESDSEKDKTIATLKEDVEKAQKQAQAAYAKAKKAQRTVAATDMSSLYPYIYLVTAEVEYEGQTLYGWYGTGFLLDDGKFVTARHVVTPYYSNSYGLMDGSLVMAPGADEEQVLLELYANAFYNMGKAKIRFTATSVSDSFTFTSDQVYSDKSQDHVVTFTFMDMEAPVRIGAGGDRDAAYYNYNRGGGKGLKANRELSKNLQQGTNLYILGYPTPQSLGAGAPILNTAICSKSGLSASMGNTIMASNDNTDGGNSGGPIFVQTDKGWEVIGIVSGSTRSKGRFVPISVIP